MTSKVAWKTLNCTWGQLTWIGKPTHTPVPCWMTATLPSRYQCMGTILPMTSINFLLERLKGPNSKKIKLEYNRISFRMRIWMRPAPLNYFLSWHQLHNHITSQDSRSYLLRSKLQRESKVVTHNLATSQTHDEV